MKAKLQQIEKRFNALKFNERRLVACAGVIGCLMLGYTLGIEPALDKNKALNNSLTQQRTDLEGLRASIAALQNKLRDPDAANREAVAVSQGGLNKIESDLKAYDSLLVSPDRMPRLLQNLIGKYPGLELVSLKTQPVSPLLARTSPSAQAQPAGQDNAPPPGGMYRHGIELTLAGPYPDLLAYAEELQRISPRPLWSVMQLKVVEYPRSELTFSLYTLSLDLPWLAM